MPTTISSFSKFGTGIANYPLIGAAVTTSAAPGTANRTYYVPISIPSRYLIRRFWWCNGATANGNIDCGIYTRKGVLLANTGSVAQSGATTVQSAAPSGGDFLLDPGSYYLAVQVSSTTATFRRQAPSVSQCQCLGVLNETPGGFGLPATATFGSPVAGYIPVFGIASVTVI